MIEIRRGLQLHGGRLLSVALTALLVGGSLLSACGRSDESHDEANAAVVRAPTGAASEIERPLEIEIFGTVEADRTATVSARVMAMVTVVRVHAGERVARGQTLLEIDPQAADGQLAQAMGGLAQARAGLVLAARNRERFEALVAVDSASALELDTARMQHDQAQGAVDEAEGAVRAASAVATDARVTAPFDARVAQRMVEVGDLAAPGRPLLTLESTRGRRLVVEIPESVAARAALDVGGKVRVAIDTHPELGLFDGEVVAAAPGVDPRSHTRRTEIALPVDDLPTGSAGRAWVEVGRVRAVTVPRDAVIERGGLSLVVIVTAEGRAATRVVTVGADLEATAGGSPRVEVLSGLSGGKSCCSV